jgi:YHS domain-containing protein
MPRQCFGPKAHRDFVPSRLREGSARICLLSLLTMIVLGLPVYSFAAEPEFGGYGAMGLVNHQRIQTDCKVNWTSKEGKLYCFSNDAAKTEFLKAPEDNVQKADDMYAAADMGDIAKGMDKFTSDDAQAFVDKLIKDKSAANGGVFVFDDPVTNTSIPLIYENVDFTRTIDGYGYFPDVIFHAKDDAAKKYLVDFWVAPQAGKLAVLETRIYEAPVQEGTTWTMEQRQPKPWWWIPASEHPGQTEQKRSWEVMSAIDGYIHTTAQNGILTLKDDKTGQMIPLQFVDVHQPVRRLHTNGQFFACTDFRKAGTTDQFYDIDFWIDTKNGNMTVSQVKVHKVPFFINGGYVQIPRYTFDPKTFDIVP